MLHFEMEILNRKAPAPTVRYTSAISAYPSGGDEIHTYMIQIKSQRKKRLQEVEGVEIELLSQPDWPIMVHPCPPFLPAKHSGGLGAGRFPNGPSSGGMRPLKASAA